MKQEHFISQAQIDAAKECIKVANHLIASGENEQRIRDNFTSRLRGLFARDLTWIEEHVVGGEAALTTHKKNKATTSFVDNLVGLTAVEYEGDLQNKRKFTEGYEQVVKYCAALLNEENDATQVLGVLSDTVRWRAYKIKEVIKTEGKPVEADDITLAEIESVDVSACDDAAAKRLLIFLTKYLQRLGSRPLAADSMAEDLGFGSLYCARHIGGLSAIVDQAFKEKPAYAKLIAELWCSFVSYVTAKGKASAFDRSEYSNELYILTLAKLICANAIAGHALINNDAELVSILNGDFFSNQGLVNFVEYDYFGWINSTAAYQKLLIPIARGLQEDLRAYDFSKAPAEDIFGRLMAQLARQSQRLLLGQEWTPAWLARAVVKRTIAELPPDVTPRFVDMCCGSGSMIVETVLQAKARIEQGGKRPLTEAKKIALLSTAITGFDIDPLAVMLSKVGWVLAARDWLGTPGTHQVSIPIYHADSLFAMTPLSKSVQHPTAELILQIAEKAMALPRFLISSAWQSVFDAALDRAYALAIGDAKLQLSQIDAEEIAEDVMKQAPPVEGTTERDALAVFIKELTETIHTLHREGRNGIWIFILRNSYRPGLVAGQFNGLVSNPPWLALSKIADNPYKEALGEIGGALNIKPTGSSFLHLEMATIFLLHAIDRYLQPGAVVGCIVPETVINGHQHNPFREASYRSGARKVEFEVKSIWRVHESAFKNRAAVLFGAKCKATKGHGNSIPGGTIQPDGTLAAGEFGRVVMGPRTVWSDVSGQVSRAIFHPADFEQGADIMPRRLFFYEKTKTDGQHIWNIAAIGAESSRYFLVSDAKQCKDFKLFSPCMVSDEFMFHVLISKMVAPFSVGSPASAFLPIRKNKAGTWEPWTNQDLLKKAEYRTTQRAFQSISKEIEQLKKVKSANDPIGLIWDRINYRNKIGKQRLPSTGFLVLTGAGGSDVCSAFLALDEIPENDLLIDQTLYWAHVSSLEEALYLTGLFNSMAANELIKAFQPRGQQGERHVHELAFGITPPFDPDRSDHREVVDATRCLIDQYESVINAAKRSHNDGLLQWLDPGKDLATRRGRLRAIIEGLPGYAEYDSACRAVYGI